MSEERQEISKINAATQSWRQGDLVIAPGLFVIHLADLRVPLVDASRESASLRRQEGQPLEPEGVAGEAVGLVVITQTCDIVRDCSKRPFVEVALLRKVSPAVANEARLLRRPSFAFLPAIADQNIVVDLDQVMTVEKSFLANWSRMVGCETDAERQVFAEALARHRSRFAFPDDFNRSMSPIRQHIKQCHDNPTDEGRFLSSITEIRVQAKPDWQAENVGVFFWFILHNAEGVMTADYAKYVDSWLALFGRGSRFCVEGIACRLDDMSASDYCLSNRLDLDALSAE